MPRRCPFHPNVHATTCLRVPVLIPFNISLHTGQPGENRTNTMSAGGTPTVVVDGNEEEGMEKTDRSTGDDTATNADAIADLFGDALESGNTQYDQDLILDWYRLMWLSNADFCTSLSHQHLVNSRTLVGCHSTASVMVVCGTAIRPMFSQVGSKLPPFMLTCAIPMVCRVHVTSPIVLYRQATFLPRPAP